FGSCKCSLAAQNFAMPAMSPTMTEGNIASWKVKEGDSFSTGDVLLEIETDKAQMDVEAQDEGKVAKILQPDGSKGVKVGTRIAVVAEMDDDLSGLSIPAEDVATTPPGSEGRKSGPDSSRTSAEAAEASQSPNKSDNNSSKGEKPPTSGQATRHSFPLYPSVAQLLHANDIPESDADKIPASGPKGRLLKGDVLSYLGNISKSYSSEQSTRISKLRDLDLSNIKVAQASEISKPSPAQAEEKSAPTREQKLQPNAEVSVSISITAVLEVQKRIQETLGITIPLSTFIARAATIANDRLPRPDNLNPTTDELFNQVLGLNQVDATTAKGNFVPQITALPATSRAPAVSSKATDIIEILSRRPALPSAYERMSPKRTPATQPRHAINTFSVSATKDEMKQAKVFLERMKTILQVEPGRLVI
ncbi:MAG: hypothetical protein Q9214_003630, partial [Letrouitia sp. 1 TL-2023]